MLFSIKCTQIHSWECKFITLTTLNRVLNILSNSLNARAYMASHLHSSSRKSRNSQSQNGSHSIGMRFPDFPARSVDRSIPHFLVICNVLIKLFQSDTSWPKWTGPLRYLRQAHSLTLNPSTYNNVHTPMILDSSRTRVLG